MMNNWKWKKKTLRDIYEEFWEFIDDDNEEFKELIKEGEKENVIIKANKFALSAKNKKNQIEDQSK